jgi:hypothetical protein
MVAIHQLAALKAQLLQAVSEIVAQGKARDASLQPQTLAQAEEQEKRLQAELAKVGQHKKELAKK